MNKKSIFNIFLLFIICLATINSAQAWYNNNWSFRVQNPAVIGLVPYQVNSLTLSNSSGTNNGIVYCNGKCRLNYTDVIFVSSSDDTTVYSHYLEVNTTGYPTGKVWVNVTGATPYLYYDNPAATTARSNESTTFGNGYRVRLNSSNVTSVLLIAHLNGDFTTEFGAAMTGRTSTWTNTYDVSTNQGALMNRSKAQSIQTNLVRNSPFTVETIFSLNGTIVADNWILGNGLAATGGGIKTNATLKLCIMKYGVGESPGCVNVSNNTYYHAALTHDGTYLRMYLDPMTTYNAAKPTLVINWTAAWVTSTAAWSIGGLSGATNATTTDHNGTMDEYAVYSAALNQFPRRNYMSPEPAWGTWSVQTTKINTLCTPSESAITTNSVTISCILSQQLLPSAQIYIQYGGYPGAPKYRTNYHTTSGMETFSWTMTGIPLQAGSTYYYNMMLLYNGVTYTISSEDSFTLLRVGQIPDYQFDRHTEELAYSDLNITTMTIVIPLAYTDIVGSIFWGIIFSLVFIMIWLRQEDISIPALLGLLIGGSLWAFIPPEWVQFAYSLVVVSFAGLMYSLIKTKS